jgi:hypothetical protein
MSIAGKLFTENLGLIGPTTVEQVKADPEKHNLYAGLCAMASEISEIHLLLSGFQERLRTIEFQTRAGHPHAGA